VAPWSSTHSDLSQIALPANDPWAAPEAQGLYDPALEKDACGVGFIADI
jgi:glutamate synthase (NADPH/NADH) large chain